jgi:chaperonin GroEL (HSP60 family)
MLFEGCRNPRSVSLLLRGGAGTMVDDLGRTARDALMVIKDVFEVPRVVGGGGAVEMELAFRLKTWAKRIPGRQQLAVLKFAEALETIPLILARSAGMDTLNAETELRSKHARGHKWFGIDALTAEFADMYERSVLDSLKVKLQVIRSATETAVEILRVDDMILGAKSYHPNPDMTASTGPQYRPKPMRTS